jgi:hypothetical protein
VDLQFAFASPPVAWSIVYTHTDLADLRVWRRQIANLLSAQHEQSSIGMEDNEITLKVSDEIEFHFCELGIVGWKVLYVILIP